MSTSYWGVLFYIFFYFRKKQEYLFSGNFTRSHSPLLPLREPSVFFQFSDFSVFCFLTSWHISSWSNILWSRGPPRSPGILPSRGRRSRRDVYCPVFFHPTPFATQLPSPRETPPNAGWSLIGSCWLRWPVLHSKKFFFSDYFLTFWCLV